MLLRGKRDLQEQAEGGRRQSLDLGVPKPEWWADLLPKSSLGSASATS